MDFEDKNLFEDAYNFLNNSNNNPHLNLNNDDTINNFGLNIDQNLNLGLDAKLDLNLDLDLDHDYFTFHKKNNLNIDSIQNANINSNLDLGLDPDLELQLNNVNNNQNNNNNSLIETIHLEPGQLQQQHIVKYEQYEIRLIENNKYVNFRDLMLAIGISPNNISREKKYIDSRHIKKFHVLHISRQYKGHTSNNVTKAGVKQWLKENKKYKMQKYITWIKQQILPIMQSSDGDDSDNSDDDDELSTAIINNPYPLTFKYSNLIKTIHIHNKNNKFVVLESELELLGNNTTNRYIDMYDVITWIESKTMYSDIEIHYKIWIKDVLIINMSHLQMKKDQVLQNLNNLNLFINNNNNNSDNKNNNNSKPKPIKRPYERHIFKKYTYNNQVITTIQYNNTHYIRFANLHPTVIPKLSVYYELDTRVDSQYKHPTYNNMVSIEGIQKWVIDYDSKHTTNYQTPLQEIFNMITSTVGTNNNNNNSEIAETPVTKKIRASNNSKPARTLITTNDSIFLDCVQYARKDYKHIQDKKIWWNLILYYYIQHKHALPTIKKQLYKANRLFTTNQINPAQQEFRLFNINTIPNQEMYKWLLYYNNDE